MAANQGAGGPGAEGQHLDLKRAVCVRGIRRPQAGPPGQPRRLGFGREGRLTGRRPAEQRWDEPATLGPIGPDDRHADRTAVEAERPGRQHDRRLFRPLDGQCRWCPGPLGPRDRPPVLAVVDALQDLALAVEHGQDPRARRVQAHNGAVLQAVEDRPSATLKPAINARVSADEDHDSSVPLELNVGRNGQPSGNSCAPSRISDFEISHPKIEFPILGASAPDLRAAEDTPIRLTTTPPTSGMPPGCPTGVPPGKSTWSSRPLARRRGRSARRRRARPGSQAVLGVERRAPPGIIRSARSALPAPLAATRRPARRSRRGRPVAAGPRRNERASRPARRGGRASRRNRPSGKSLAGRRSVLQRKPG